MLRFIHSADWQLGCAFRGFGQRADALRAERLATLRRALELARAERVHGFLIAGDLFDDPHVAPALVSETFGIFADFPDVPVFILPGNHDPHTGPGSLWTRPPFAAPSSHITVFLEPAAAPLGPARLLASPLRQRLSTADPSALLAPLVQPGAINVGLTHGALALESKHQPNDHPIAPDAATRLGLDYLGVGHWHGWLALDGGRLLMPGTPEPDAFDHAAGRCVALVEIAAPGATPVVHQRDVAGLTWQTLAAEFPLAPDALLARISAYGENSARTVLRVVLRGAAARAELAALLPQLEAAVAPFFAAQIVDETTLALTPAEIAALSAEQPLLGEILADLATARRIATGHGEGDTLTLAELQEIAATARLETTALDESFFKTAADLLAAKLPEARA